MTGVENVFIYWPGRHNLGPWAQFQQIYRPGKPPGQISHWGTWTGCFEEVKRESSHKNMSYEIWGS